MKTIKTIHIKVTNPYYPGNGTESPFTSACQKNTAKTDVREKTKNIKKMDFVKLVEENAENLCPLCVESLKPAKPVFVNPKTAYYQLGRVSGKVSLKSDGKISYSINGGSYLSYSEKFKFKNLGAEIVKSDFNHTAIIRLEANNIVGLNSKLKEETKDLKEEYILKTKEYAKKFFAYVGKQLARPVEDWFKEYKVPFEYKGQYISPIKYNEAYRKMKSKIDNFRLIIKEGFEKFEDDEIKYAERHYENSIERLAFRLNKKGVKDDTEFKITKSRIGLNLEMTFEHNGLITKAWTIVAEGPIQRAHYRYLVK